ncbi:hypothetical protein GCM10029963_66990 [Micromonospora andamanensis]
MAKLTLSGKVVAITGGSLGIGRATAEAFIAAGAQVAIGARDLDRATSTARSIGAIAFPSTSRIPAVWRSSAGRSRKPSGRSTS